MHFYASLNLFTSLSILAFITLSLAEPAKRAHFTNTSTIFDNPITGYLNRPQITQHFGPGSPFFSLATRNSDRTPPGCSVTFANVLSRHGARFPTKGDAAVIKAALTKVQLAIKYHNFSIPSKFAFLHNFTYNLGQDNLTHFGQQQMVNSGLKFFARYGSLGINSAPFLRASSSPRVIESAQNFTQGFNYAAKAVGTGSKLISDDSIVVIQEAIGSNDTLHVTTCNAINAAPLNTIGGIADQTWVEIFTPSITARLNAYLPGANLNNNDTVALMQLCSFETVATPNGAISPFCNLFTDDEWVSYGFKEDLDKYFNNGAGNKLGSTLGVGYVNELIARMTNTVVFDHTSTNSTLDLSNATFPLDLSLYADFSHDTQITSILFALGFFNTTSANGVLNPKDRRSGNKIRYSSSRTVPFAARVYFEKLRCDDYPEDMVRILVNDAVQQMPFCGGDRFGRCALSKFVKSQSFARSGGLSTEC